MEQSAVIKTGPIFEGKGPEIVGRSVETFATEAVLYLLRKVKQKTPRGVFGAEGGLLASEHWAIVKGATITKGIVAATSPYAEVVEKGRTPGKKMPPAGTLVRWLQKKMDLSETEAKRIEYVVRRKIGLKGFEGAHMFEKTWEDDWPEVEAMAQRYGLVLAKELSGG